MAFSDYLCVYRQFFEEFAKSTELENHRPMRVNIYNLSIDELVGEVMQSCVNFLTERRCPNCLVVHITKIVVGELLSEAKKQPEEVNDPLKLNRKTFDKIREVCLRYTDNEKLSSLPGPVHETQFSTHATKHTRRRMEDRNICLPRFNTLHGIQSNSEAEYYGVFDGHAGVNAACYSVSHLHQFLAESQFYPDNPVEAFREAYEKTDSRLNLKNEESGTASLAILHQRNEKKLTVSWVGDSQALLVSEDSYVLLVDPHKPERPDERKRIEDLGGCILWSQDVCRVNGATAVSRALGDRKLKPFVCAEPEFRVVNLTGSEHFVVMGCDGLWDVVTPQQVLETVYFEVKQNEGGIGTVAKRLVDLAKENNSTDNITVIVFFLTDPSEINNRSIDVTGHRPKIILQNGVIMDPNYQTNEPGLNGIYETNGNHFDDPLRNESDEDLGPETDVDAVDDVLTSPKTMNPFGNDCWQKVQTNMENANMDKLIEFRREETIKMEIGDGKDFSEGLAGELKNVGSNAKDLAGMIFANNTMDGKLVEDMFMKDMVNMTCQKTSEGFGDTEDSDLRNEMRLSEDKNSFEGSVINNYSGILNVKNNGSEDNKYGADVKMESDELRDLVNSNYKENQFELSTGGVQEAENAKDGIFGENARPIENEEHETFTGNPFGGPRYNEDLTETIGDTSETKIEEEAPEKKVDLGGDNKEVAFTASHDHLLDHEVPLVEKTNTNAVGTGFEFGATHEPTPTLTIKEPSDLFMEHQPVDLNHTLEHSSIIETVDILKPSSDMSSEVDVQPDKSEESMPELLQPTAPALEGEIKDEIVAESCGEVEDSEDDEWNYIKVEGGARPAVENQHSDLVSSEEGKEKNSMMNSPLNPDAAEFIPVSPVGVGEEYPETPVKNVPYELTDIVASSPNWATMENVALPEESEFLKEIKSRPSNLVDMSSNREENGDSFRNDVNEIDLTNSFDKSNVSDNIVYSPEPQGIALAKDMTGSFIDPATMSSRDGDGTEDKFGAVKSPLVEDIEPPFEEKKVTVSNEEPQFDQKPKMEYDFVSPPYVKEDVSPVSLMAATPKPTAFEALSSPESEASTLPIAEAPQTVTSDLQATVPATPFLAGEDAISPVPLNKSEDVEKVNETTLAAGVVAGAVAAAAATSAALLTSPTTPVKKDDKKPASKTGTPMKTTKSPTTKITETKTTTTLKRTSTPGQSTRSPLTAKTTSTTPTSPTKTTVSRVSTVTKTAPKSPSQATTLSKAPTRPKTTPTPATSKAPVSRTSVTTTTVKSATVGPKPAARTTATTAATTLSAKPKPRVSSALTEKKTTVTMNGDAKTGVKRTETTTVTKRPGGTSTLTTRVTLSARPATAPARTAVSKTTVTTTTRTVTAKPRTTLGNTTTTTTTTSTVTSAGRTSLGARKPGSLSTDKHTKEMANRLTSRTSTTATKMNGVAKLPGTGTTKTMRTTLTTKTTKVPGTPPKTKTVSKTEIKAEKILDNSIEIIQSEKETPPMENNKDINLINSIASE